jgi:hypothetical protein
MDTVKLQNRYATHNLIIPPLRGLNDFGSFYNNDNPSGLYDFQFEIVKQEVNENFDIVCSGTSN